MPSINKSYEKVLRARGKQRPVASDCIAACISDFIELHGDRGCKDDSAIIAGIGYLGQMPVTVIGIEKGHTTPEKIAHNFGAASPEGYRKALRQMKLAEKFHRPVLCFVDTAGAYCGIEAEEHGQAEAIARNLAEMMTLKTPIISVIIGEGGSGGAIGLAVADEVWMFSGAYYSVVAPESCANILWKDMSHADEAAESLCLTADPLLELGIIDRKIEEPENFLKQQVNDEFFNALRIGLYTTFEKLCSKSTRELLDTRYEKFRRVGRYD